jgi:glycosyltransferase involved in cell wall biosynthesis
MKPDMDMDKWKIVYHHRTRGDGAEGIHISEMIAAFKELGHKIRLVCPASSRRPLGISLGLSNISSSKAQGVWGKMRMLIQQLAELFYNFISIPRLFFACVVFRPDVIYERYSCYHFAGALVANLMGIPLVLEVNATYSGRFNRRILSFPNLHRFLENAIFRSCDRICVVSNALRQCVLDRGIGQERVIVTSNCINPNLLVKDPEIRPRTRESLAIPANAIVYGFVGSLRRWHGIELMLQVVPGILDEVSDCFFLIVGSGELDREVRDMIRNHGVEDRVILTGGVEHQKVAALICAMDVCLQADSNEWCSPMKLLEYMLQAKACVAPRMDNIMEIVFDRETGVLFEKSDSVDFQMKLLELGADSGLRETVGRNAQRYVLEERVWTVNATSVLKGLLKYRLK